MNRQSLEGSADPSENLTKNTAEGKTAAPSWRHIILKGLWLLLYPAAFITADWMQRHPDIVESFFSQGIYPPLSSAVGGIFSIFPFSFAEFLLYALISALLIFIAVCIVKGIRHHLPLRQFLGWVLTVLIIGGAGINAFYWMWGFNYYRVPLRERLHLGYVEKTPELLVALCSTLADTANQLREDLPENEEGVFWYPEGKTAPLHLIPDAYRQLGEVMPMFSRAVYTPKPVLASELMSYAGIAGIFIPFTEEANVNIDDPPLLVGSSAAHEAAHFLGVASEDEANFTAYLACMASGEPSLQYSGVMLALVHAGNMLAKAAPESYNALWEKYSDAVVRDFDQYNQYLHDHEGEAAETVDKINDNYLKSHGQTQGVASYGQMVDLLLDFVVQNSQ